MSLADIVIGVAAALIAEEVFGWVDKFGQWLVRKASRRLPADLAGRYEQEWLLEITSLPKISRLVFALDLQRAAFVMNHQVALPHVSILSASLVRLIDFTQALMNLFVALPFFLIALIALKVERGIAAPIFERHERTGYMGRRFWLLRFAICDLRYSSQPGECGPITRVGRLMHAIRLDELPQLLNVLKGEMSLVGPRAEPPEFAEMLAEYLPEYMERHRVRPGITGLAQVKQPFGNALPHFQRKLEHDLEYVATFGVRRYFSILLETMAIVLFGMRSSRKAK